MTLVSFLSVRKSGEAERDEMWAFIDHFRRSDKVDLAEQ
jgi:hypothetical protein